jgi:hypothetical protein
MLRHLAWAAGAVLLLSGCFTFDIDTSVEEPGFPEFVEKHTQKDIVGVAAFVCEEALTRDRYSARNVFSGVAGSTFGVTLYPWDLRLTRTPGPVEIDTDFNVSQFDEVLTTELAINLKQKNFGAKIINPTEWETAKEQGIVEVRPEDLLAQAKEYGCHYLYVVCYNEYTKLRYAVDMKTYPNVGTYRRLKNLKGSVLLPSRAVFRVADQKRIFARAREFEKMFYMPLLSWGFISDIDEDATDHEKWFGKMSGKDISEARGNCALFLVETDFTRSSEQDTKSPTAPGPDGYPADDEEPAEDEPAEDELVEDDPVEDDPVEEETPVEDEKPAEEE